MSLRFNPSLSPLRQALEAEEQVVDLTSQLQVKDSDITQLNEDLKDASDKVTYFESEVRRIGSLRSV